MIENKWLIFLSDKKRWLVLFVLTYLAFWYWLPKEIPLFYSLAIKEDRLTSQYSLLLIPLAVFIFFAIGEYWLEKLALQNTNMIALIRLFLVIIAAFAYWMFLKIILMII